MMKIKITVVCMFVCTLFLCVVGIRYPQPLFANRLDAPSEWDIECIDCPRYFELSNQSAKFGSDGVLRVAYGGDHLYFAQETVTSIWETDVVDSTRGVGAEAELLLDSADNPHIFYHSETDHLKYAHHDGTQWAFHTFDWDANFSVTIDNSDQLHLSVINDGVLHYITHDGTEWVIQPLENVSLFSDYVTQDSSIAVASDNAPHIAYTTSISPTELYGPGTALRYARFDDGAWISTTVTNTLDTWGTDSVSFALDNTDSPHIVYVSNTEMYYMTFQFPEWTVEYVTAGYLSHYVDSSIQFDENNDIQIAYLIKWNSADPYPWRSPYELHYAEQSETGWFLSRFYSHGSDSPTLITDPSGEKHIIATGHDKLQHIQPTWDNGTLTYTYTTIDMPSDVGIHVEMLVDDDGKRHLSYHDDVNESIRYALESGSAWRSESVVATENIGYAMRGDNAIGIDESGQTHIIYDDYSRVSRLFYAYHTINGEWRIPNTPYYNGDFKEFSTFISAGFEGTFRGTSIARESDDVVHEINSVNGFDYITLNGEEESEAQEIDSDIDAVNVAITLDANEQLHLAYYDATNQVIKHYTPEFGVSVIDTSSVPILEEGYELAPTIDIVVDALNNIHVSYYDIANKDLKYAYHSGTSWETTTVVSEGDVGRWSTITVDGNRVGPQIAYYDGTTRDLKMASIPFDPTTSIYLPIISQQ